MKEQELTKLRLQMKDYDFVKETYLEIQNQAKVCVITVFPPKVY